MGDAASEIPPALISDESLTKEGPPLLLPAHVTVLGGKTEVVTLEDLPQTTTSEGEEYIEYLDFDDHKAHCFYMQCVRYRLTRPLGLRCRAILSRVSGRLQTDEDCV